MTADRPLSVQTRRQRNLPARNVRGSAHGIQFMNRGYEKYRDKCLELGGQEYNQLETFRDEKYHPFRLSRVAKHQSESSQAGHIADSEEQ